MNKNLYCTLIITLVSTPCVVGMEQHKLASALNDLRYNLENLLTVLKKQSKVFGVSKSTEEKELSLPEREYLQILLQPLHTGSFGDTLNNIENNLSQNLALNEIGRLIMQGKNEDKPLMKLLHDELLQPLTSLDDAAKTSFKEAVGKAYQQLDYAAQIKTIEQYIKAQFGSYTEDDQLQLLHLGLFMLTKSLNTTFLEDMRLIALLKWNIDKARTLQEMYVSSQKSLEANLDYAVVKKLNEGRSNNFANPDYNDLQQELLFELDQTIKGRLNKLDLPEYTFQRMDYPTIFFEPVTLSENSATLYRYILWRLIYYFCPLITWDDIKHHMGTQNMLSNFKSDTAQDIIRYLDKIRSQCFGNPRRKPLYDVESLAAATLYWKMNSSEIPHLVDVKGGEPYSVKWEKFLQDVSQAYDRLNVYTKEQEKVGMGA